MKLHTAATALLMMASLTYNAQAARPCTGKDIYGARNETIVYGVITGMSGNTE